MASFNRKKERKKPKLFTAISMHTIFIIIATLFQHENLCCWRFLDCFCRRFFPLRSVRLAWEFTDLAHDIFFEQWIDLIFDADNSRAYTKTTTPILSICGNKRSVFFGSNVRHVCMGFSQCYAYNRFFFQCYININPNTIAFIQPFRWFEAFFSQHYCKLTPLETIGGRQNWTGRKKTVDILFNDSFEFIDMMVIKKCRRRQ